MILSALTAHQATFQAWTNDDKVYALYLYDVGRVKGVLLYADRFEFTVANTAGFRMRLDEEYDVTIAANELVQVMPGASDYRQVNRDWTIPAAYKRLLPVELRPIEFAETEKTISTEPPSPLIVVSDPDEFPDDEELLRRYNEQLSEEDADEAEDYWAPGSSKWL